MQRFLDFLDESAGGLIRVAYLLWGIVAVAAYFSDGTAMPVAITATLAALAPWVLAFATETHAYLTARRVRAAWQGTQANPADPAARHSLRTNLGILAGLLAFSMFAQLQYLGATWTSPHTALSLPGPLAYLIRAIVVPLAFLAAALLAPMGEPPLAQKVRTEAHRVAAATFRVARKQWRARLREMRRAGQDVTGALVQLVDDPDDRRVIEIIHQAMYPTMPEVTEQTPDDGTPLTLLPPRQAARSRKGVRTASVEKKARRVWQPGMTVTQLQRAAGISRTAAAKWGRVLTAEQAESEARA